MNSFWLLQGHNEINLMIEKSKQQTKNLKLYIKVVGWIRYLACSLNCGHIHFPAMRDAVNSKRNFNNFRSFSALWRSLLRSNHEFVFEEVYNFELRYHG